MAILDLGNDIFDFDFYPILNFLKYLQELPVNQTNNDNLIIFNFSFELEIRQVVAKIFWLGKVP